MNLDKWKGIVAKAWNDEEFRSKLLNSPNEVLADNGVEVPDGLSVEVHENGPDTMHLVLPSNPLDTSVQARHDDSYDPGF